MKKKKIHARLQKFIADSLEHFAEADRNKQRWMELKIQVDTLQDDVRRLERQTGLADGPAELLQPRMKLPPDG